MNTYRTITRFTSILALAAISLMAQQTTTTTISLSTFGTWPLCVIPNAATTIPGCPAIPGEETWMLIITAPAGDTAATGYDYSITGTLTTGAPFKVTGSIKRTGNQTFVVFQPGGVIDEYTLTVQPATKRDEPLVVTGRPRR